MIPATAFSFKEALTWSLLALDFGLVEQATMDCCLNGNGLKRDSDVGLMLVMMILFEVTETEAISFSLIVGFWKGMDVFDLMMKF